MSEKAYAWTWPVIGQDKATEFLERAGRNGKIAQAYVFSGRDDLGKNAVALAFARNLREGRDGFDSDLCVLEREPDKKTISINQTREFIKSLHLSSFLDSYKIGLIKESELLSEEAKSALLKTLEEPQNKVIIILLVSDETELPATILSRSQILRFPPVPAALIYDYLIDNYGAGRSLAKDIANLSLGRPLVAADWFNHPDIYRHHLERATIWLEALGETPHRRLQALDKIYNDRSWSALAVKAAGEVLDLAEGLSRDLFLLSLRQFDRAQFSALQSVLEKVLADLEEKRGEVGPIILAQFKHIAQAREYLAANVNPRLVLEQLIINI